MKIRIVHTWREDGYSTPKWYGEAYYDYPRRTRVFYPIPLHLLVGIGRWSYLVFKWRITDWFSSNIREEQVKRGEYIPGSSGNHLQELRSVIQADEDFYDYDASAPLALLDRIIKEME